MRRGLSFRRLKRPENLRFAAYLRQAAHVISARLNSSLPGGGEEALGAERTQLRAELGELSAQLIHFFLRTIATLVGGYRAWWVSSGFEFRMLGMV